YGVPAASFWLGGWLLRKRADDLPARTVDAAAILFSVLLVIWEIRHYVTGGEIYKPLRSDLEIMLFANAGLAMTIGLEHIRVRTQSIVHNLGALVDGAHVVGRAGKPYRRAGLAIQHHADRRRRFLQCDSAWLWPAGRVGHYACVDCTHDPPATLPHRC